METSYLTQQLLYQLPILLVCVAGLVLALIFIRTSLGPSILTLVATGTVFLAAVAVALIQAHLVQARTVQGWSAVEYGRLTNLVAIAGSIARALGFGLLVVAAFIGRTRATSSRLEAPHSP